ncbi:MAG TPA: adenylate/guanylate cyclase domain-containing protein, partial [Actinobacteria bacterium]|nr:adenylate/guanylate cyclase domain-containing protein [Actinomycetota bacterium]
MISIISMVIIMALSGMIFLATWFFLQDSRIRVEENNLKVSEIVSMKIEEDIKSFGNAASLLMLGANQAGEDKEDFVRYFFRNEPGVIFVGLHEIGVNFYNKDILLDYNIDENFINNIITENTDEINQAKDGITAVINVSPYLGVPVMTLAIPYRQGRDLLSMVMLVDVRKSFMKLIETKGITLTYIVNEKGEIIAHPDESYIIDAQNISEQKVVKDMLASPVSTGQIRFTDENSKTYLGSYRKITTGRLGIITQVEESVAFEAVYNIQRRNIYLMVMVLSITVLIVYFFSKTLTSPVKNLVIATKMIEGGDFKINLKAKSKDEIGVLTTAFVEMGKGLEEKERMKDAFGRFVNQEIAELAMKGEIQLGGEIKPATIFFSDIRSFTAISEKLTPSEVVEFLNEYMTLMVNCVNETHGVVDKYIGDAIMAVWGTPISHGNDAENS